MASLKDTLVHRVVRNFFHPIGKTTPRLRQIAHRLRGALGSARIRQDRGRRAGERRFSCLRGRAAFGERRFSDAAASDRPANLGAAPPLQAISAKRCSPSSPRQPRRLAVLCPRAPTRPVSLPADRFRGPPGRCSCNGCRTHRPFWSRGWQSLRTEMPLSKFQTMPRAEGQLWMSSKGTLSTVSQVVVGRVALQPPSGLRSENCRRDHTQGEGLSRKHGTPLHAPAPPQMRLLRTEGRVLAPKHPSTLFAPSPRSDSPFHPPQEASGAPRTSQPSSNRRGNARVCDAGIPRPPIPKGRCNGASAGPDAHAPLWLLPLPASSKRPSRAQQPMAPEAAALLPHTQPEGTGKPSMPKRNNTPTVRVFLFFGKIRPPCAYCSKDVTHFKTDTPTVGVLLRFGFLPLLSPASLGR